MFGCLYQVDAVRNLEWGDELVRFMVGLAWAARNKKAILEYCNNVIKELLPPVETEAHELVITDAFDWLKPERFVNASGLMMFEDEDNPGESIPYRFLILDIKVKHSSSKKNPHVKEWLAMCYFPDEEPDVQLFESKLKDSITDGNTKFWRYHFG